MCPIFSGSWYNYAGVAFRLTTHYKQFEHESIIYGELVLQIVINKNKDKNIETLH